MSKEHTPLKGCSIAIFDRNTSALKHLKDELTHLGASAVDFLGPKDSIAKAAGRGYGIVFIDSNLDENRSLSTLLEEFRSEKTHWKTVLAVTTADKNKNTLIEAAQYDADEYILRPFSIEELSRRIVSAREKKKHFEAIDRSMHEGRYFDAASECDEVLSAYPRYRVELLKKKIQAWIMDFESVPKAESLLRTIVSSEDNNVWFQCELAKLLIAKNEHVEGIALLRKAVADRPDYLLGVDLLAKTLAEQKLFEEAIGVLEDSGAMLFSNTERVRLLSTLHLLQGDLQKHKTNLIKLTDKTAGSPLLNPSDYHHLSSLYVQEEKYGEAYSVLTPLRARQDLTEHEFAEGMTSVEIEMKQGREDKASEAFFGMARKLDAKTGKLSPGGTMRYAVLSAKFGRSTKVQSLMESLNDVSLDVSTKLILKLVKDSVEESVRLGIENHSTEVVSASKPIATPKNSGGARGDLAKRVQGALTE